MKNNKKKYKVIYIILSIIAILVMAVGFTYAFFNSKHIDVDNSVNILITSEEAGGVSFNATGTDIGFEINNESMSKRNIDNEVANNIGNIDIELNLTDNVSYECSYNIYYVWDNTSDNYTFADSNQNTLEFTYELVEGSNTLVNETNFVNTTSNPQYVYSGSIVGDSSNTSNLTYGLKTRFYNIDSFQDIGGKSFKINFYVDDVDCHERSASTLATKIQSLAGTSSSNSDGEWQVLNETVTINNQNYTNTIYTGANPNNFVTFNNEKWRIIGVYNEDTHGKSGQKLVKIIKNDSLGDMAWDSNNRNNWNNAPIKTTLQSTITDTTSQNMIEEVTWHLGGPDTYNNTTKNTASGYYTYERGTQVYSGNPTTWTGLIGLMYPSDWGYATNGGSTYSRSTCLGQQMYGWYDGSYKTDCAGNSWLWYAGATSTSKGTAASQWTITPRSSIAYVFFVNSDGYVVDYYANYSFAARPVLYLKTGVKTTIGDGSYNNPYQLSM